MRGRVAGKTFLEKSFPRTPFKRLDTRDRDMGCRIVLPLRKFSTGFVRSTIGDPDLRSPSGFDFGLRPPLRMTRRAGKVGFRGVVHDTFSVGKCLKNRFILI